MAMEMFQNLKVPPLQTHADTEKEEKSAENFKFVTNFQMVLECNSYIAKVGIWVFQDAFSLSCNFGKLILI